MTLYDKQMKEMTPQKLAEKNVQLVAVNGTQLFYLTSSGQLFNTDKGQQAFEHEYNWLMQPIEEEGEPEPACEGCETECADCDRAN